MKEMFDAAADPRQRELMAGLIAKVWAEEDPMRAAALADELIDETAARQRVMGAIVGTWGQHEPAAAMAWIMEQDTAITTEDMMRASCPRS